MKPLVIVLGLIFVLLCIFEGIISRSKNDKYKKFSVIIKGAAVIIVAILLILNYCNY